MAKTTITLWHGYLTDGAPSNAAASTACGWFLSEASARSAEHWNNQAPWGRVEEVELSAAELAVEFSPAWSVLDRWVSLREEFGCTDQDERGLALRARRVLRALTSPGSKIDHQEVLAVISAIQDRG